MSDGCPKEDYYKAISVHTDMSPTESMQNIGGHLSNHHAKHLVRLK